jgi:IS5 family transposase
VERKFAEGNQRHGLKKARYWGLGKVSIQSFTVAIVVNLKRMVKLVCLAAPEPRLAYAA